MGPRSAREAAYHHGDLRRALVEEAVRAIAEAGVGVLSLRDVARRAGVSHAAPAHHFGDKAGLLAAVAAEGFRLLADEMRAVDQKAGDALAIGKAYVTFAIHRSAYFEVMFRPELQQSSDPELMEARQLVCDQFFHSALRLKGSRESAALLGAVLWSLVHGVAVLTPGGNFPGTLGDDPEQLGSAALEFVFRRR
jgi:AcrR family transcriptional regulator